MWVYGSGFPKSHNLGKKNEDFTGWGTALKPAHEPMVVARKPISEKTILANAEKWGVGAYNIDASRCEGDRWPANFIHDGSQEVLDLFPEAKGGNWTNTDGARPFNNDGKKTNAVQLKSDNSIGSAARFFYVPKVNKKDRNEGLDPRASAAMTVGGTGVEYKDNRAEEMGFKSS